ncbi:MAG: beta-lactamase family protein [Chitinophagales bacterium]|nr:beta-lactamase family protein [Chitinophagales bacterium]
MKSPDYLIYPCRSQGLYCLVLLLLCFSNNAFSQTSFEGTAKTIDSYFERLESFGLSGSLLIGNKDEILFQAEYGSPASENHIERAYLVGSLTKQFTATAILYLEQQGLLNTQDKLADHLRDIPSDKSGISIHQLLTHTAGLADGYWDEHPSLTAKQYIELMLAKPLESSPGQRFSYSNFGYHLLAIVIEVVSNKNYEQFLVEELFLPNGLKCTGFNLVDWQKEQIATYTDWTTEGYEQYLKNPLDRPIYLQPEGSGGLLSTTKDLYKWYQLIFHSQKILSPSSRQKLLRIEQEYYGYGWEIYPTLRGTQLIEHGGYDSWVGVVTGLYHYVDEDIVVIFLGNTHMSQLLLKEDLMNTIESLIFGGTVAMPPKPIQMEVKAENHLGVYGKGERAISFSKGRKGHQIRLRTKDEQSIQKLLFPHLNDPTKNTDAQLAYIFDLLKLRNYEPLKDVLLYQSSFDRVLNRYTTIWNQLNQMMGVYQGVNVLHTKAGQYEGKFELQLYIELIFEQGSFFGRAFRDHNGRIHLQELKFPKKLELYLIPSGKDEYIFWNIKTGITSTIKFEKNKVFLNGEEELELLMK